MTLRGKIALGIGLICTTLVFGQEVQKGSKAPAPQNSDTLSVDVDLVLVTTTVTDSNSRYVTGLKKEDFQVFEDKVQQDIQYFSAEQVPLSVGVIFDVSGSMNDKLSAARSAAVTFMRMGNREDEYFLVEFGNEAHLVSDFTTDIGRLQQRIAFTKANGMTALYDAMYMGLTRLDRGNNTRKALLLITDGQDNHSRYSFSDIRDYAKERDVQIYAIGIVDPVSSQYSDSGRAPIQSLAEITGGRAFFPDSPYQLEDICTQIGIDLKNQYVIGYKSTNGQKDGKWRKIQVKMNHAKGAPKLYARAKTGYFASGLMRAMK
jgi:Ca-activated chloride channel homolog